MQRKLAMKHWNFMWSTWTRFVSFNSNSGMLCWVVFRGHSFADKDYLGSQRLANTASNKLFCNPQRKHHTKDSILLEFSYSSFVVVCLFFVFFQSACRPNANGARDLIVFVWTIACRITKVTCAVYYFRKLSPMNLMMFVPITCVFALLCSL